MAKTVDYYFTPPSPWTYLGHERFVAMCRSAGATINVKPADMGRIFSVSGGLPLNQRAEQRRAYRLHELARWRDALGLPLNVHPRYFPVSGDAASRMIIAARQEQGSEAALKLAGALLRAVWADELNIADPATLSSIAGNCGLAGQALLDASQAAAVQAEYERNTEEAIAAKVFGAPWYVVDGEPFWGQDRLDFVERALKR